MELIYTNDLCTGCNKCVRCMAEEETKKIAEIRDQKRNAQETRTLSDFTKDLLTQNDQKAEAILPKITHQRSGRKHEYHDAESVNDCRKHGRNFFPDDLCTEYDRRNAG